MTKKINLCGIKRDGFPLPKLSLCAFFHIFQKHFSKEFKKNALDIIRVLFKDKSITIDIVPQFKIFLDFSRGVTPFYKKKGSQRLDPSWNFFCCEPAKCSGTNKLLSENIVLKKLHYTHAKITVIKNIFYKKITPLLIVHA